MSYTEVTERGWFSRIAGSLWGMLFGVMLLVGSVVLLWWNEGNSVHTMQDIAEVRGITTSVPSDKVDAAHDGKVVHTQGMAKTEDVLTDPNLGISVTGLRLQRTLEMYQWDEDSESKEEKKLGGGTKTVTTYTYDKEWSESLKDSSDFKEKGHENPKSFPGNLSQLSLSARAVTLGGFDLTESIVEDIDAWEKVGVKESDLDRVEDSLKGQVKLYPDGFYIGSGTHTEPKIGDTRITFSVVKPTEISLISQQTGKTFKPYMTRNQNGFERVETGKKSMEEMFASAETENTIITWVLRFVGWLMMFIGFCCVFGPLSVIADFIPFVGGMVGFGASIFSFLVASIGSMMVVAVAWMAYRPWLSGGLLVTCIFLMVTFRKKKG